MQRVALIRALSQSFCYWYWGPNNGGWRIDTGSAYLLMLSYTEGQIDDYREAILKRGVPSCEH